MRIRSPDSRHRARLVAFPLLILLVAGMLVIWKRPAPAGRADIVVEEFVRHLAIEVETGRTGERSRAVLREAVGPYVMEQLRALLAGRHPQNGLDIRSSAGDVPDGDGSATHTVVITTPGGGSIGLRLLFDEGSSTVRVLGSWILKAKS